MLATNTLRLVNRMCLCLCMYMCVYKIITEDFSAKIGFKTKEEDFESMGAFGIRERNESGDRLLKFAEERKLTIYSKYTVSEAKN